MCQNLWSTLHSLRGVEGWSAGGLWHTVLAPAPLLNGVKFWHTRLDGQGIEKEGIHAPESRRRPPQKDPPPAFDGSAVLENGMVGWSGEIPGSQALGPERRFSLGDHRMLAPTDAIAEKVRFFAQCQLSALLKLTKALILLVKLSLVVPVSR